jgi:hypothetical protein
MAVGWTTGQTTASDTQAAGSTGGTSQKTQTTPTQPGQNPAPVSATQADEKLAKRVNELAQQLDEAQRQVAGLLKVAEKLAKQGPVPAGEDPSKAAAPADTKGQKVVQNADSSPDLDKLQSGVNAIKEQLSRLQTKLDTLPPGSLSAAAFKPKPLTELTKGLEYSHTSSSTTRNVGSTSNMIRQEISIISLKLEASRQSSQGLQSQLRSKATQLAASVRERDAKYLEWYKAQNDEAEANRKGSSQEDIDQAKRKVDELARAKGELDRKVEDTQNQFINLIKCIGKHETDVGELAHDRTLAGLVQEFLKASSGGAGSANAE